MANRSRVFNGRRLVLWVVAALLGLFAIERLVRILEIGGVHAPAAPAPTLIRLDQGWDPSVSKRFHHQSQGTRILPLTWFLALEQPLFTPLPVGKLASRDYLARFGFLYETSGPHPPSAKANQPGAKAPAPPGSVEAANDEIVADQRAYDLPVGFAIEKQFVAPYADPEVKQPIAVVGLTCAACHTGRIEVGLDDGTAKSVLIDGGSSMIHIALFQKAVGQALYLTRFFPMRFRRFARGVFHEELPDDDPRKVQLAKDLSRFIDLGLASQLYAKEHKLNGTEAGVGRTDALGLIGNRVFGVLNDENMIITDAPVNFPPLWDTSWFDWVQYNASIRTPLARNIGEALGVGALVNLKKPTAPPYQSTVNVEGLFWLEDVLGGDEPFKGLQPPKWKDMVKAVLGKDADENSPYFINEAKAQQGEKLYGRYCARCHLPPRKTLKDEWDRNDFRHFTEPDPASRRRFLRLNVVDLNVIGTDPNQALNFYRRVAVAPEPQLSYPAPRGQGYEDYVYWSASVKQGYPKQSSFATISAEDGLFRVTSMIRRRAFSSPRLLLLLPDVVLSDDPAEAAAKRQNTFVITKSRGHYHVRYDDTDGATIVDVDTDGDQLASQRAQLAELEAYLAKHWHPQALSRDEKVRIAESAVPLFLPSAPRFVDEDARKRKRLERDRYRGIPEKLDEGNEDAIIEGEGKDWVIKANLGYRARPHDGVWATPPYLHNGSVPNLYQMLLPAAERSRQFYLGSTRFNPKFVGYETSEFDGAFLMDTTLPGNSNQGHEFRNLELEEFERLKGWKWDGTSGREERWSAVLGVDLEPLSVMSANERWEKVREKTEQALQAKWPESIKGVIGPEFTDDERWQIVEYLKTL